MSSPDNEPPQAPAARARAPPAAKALAGRWKGADGEEVATIRGKTITWPDGSKKEFQIEKLPEGGRS